MAKYTNAHLEKAALNVYADNVAIYGLKGAIKINGHMRSLLRQETLRRKRLPVSERPDEEEEITSTTKTKTKLKKLKKKKGPGMFASLCKLFDEKGVHKVTYSEAKKCAKEAKPDSNLSSGHFKWYKKKYKEQRR